ncbi:unnamed protein product [Penicillium salamii]|uniref:Dienelactone hydrolase domain-containing protein n=1 Tax=Penicillium salamii TaxID=1612424 RepID=A0A9W4IXE6_9EURO|nr:unnamed protein product [Penicillium salamii]
MFRSKTKVDKILWLGRDFLFTTAQRHESEQILDQLEVPYEINMFSDVDHGFAVRCDLTKPRQKFAKEQAFDQAANWFDIFLKE